MNHENKKRFTKMTESSAYVPPKVWTWDAESGGTFAKINRPISGKTHDAELPVGKHPLQLYSQGTPNGVKVTVLLEEMLATGEERAEYDGWLLPINGAQFGSGFVDINPNSKIPALVDRSGEQSIRVFSLAPSCCIWRKNLISSCQKIPQIVLRCSHGCSGRWEALLI